MPAMKLTPNAAMRARDVSRPHPEHLAEAEAAEASAPGGSRARSGSPDAAAQTSGWEDRERPGRDGREERDGRDNRGETDAAADGNGRAAMGARPGYPRRRRGPRDGRGRPSR